jgi:hypothetical protein
LSLHLEAPAYAWEVDNLVGWNIDKISPSMKGSVNLATKLEAQQMDPQSLPDGINSNRAPAIFSACFLRFYMV